MCYLWEIFQPQPSGYNAKYCRVQHLVDGREPKNWDVRTFAEIEYI